MFKRKTSKQVFQINWNVKPNSYVNYSCYTNNGTKKDVRDEPDLPDIHIYGIRPETKSFCFFIIDYDTKTPFCHFARFNIPGTTQVLHSNSGMKAENDGKTLGFYPLCPPRGETHTYYLILVALKSDIPLSTGATWLQVNDQLRSADISGKALIYFPFQGPIE